jgi:hypothetical protein
VLSAHGLGVDLFEHGDGLGELGVEVGFEDAQDVDQDGVAEGIEDLVAFFAIDEDLFTAEDGEVLGGVSLFEAELLDELAGGAFAMAEGFDDGDAGRVSEALEDIGFEGAEVAAHVYDYIRNLEYRVIDEVG